MKFVIDKHIPELEERIRRAHPEVEVVPLSRTEITADAVRDADALIVRTHTRCNAALLERSRVRLVGTATIGMNHVDTEWCRNNGILAVNAPGCNAPAVMQYVAASLHAAGFDPRRHTLGVVGKGNIGSIVTALYRRAGARVLVCDPPRRDAGFADEDYLPLEQLLAEADAITFPVPLTREGPYPTYHLLKPGMISSPKIIVNASRGSVLAPSFLLADTPAHTLIIDTWPFEEEQITLPSSGHAAFTDRALIATPHIAGYSLQGKQRATRSMIEALNGFFGLHIGTEGLTDYDFRNRLPELETVISSYSPQADSDIFKGRPDSLEALRDAYPLRQEAGV